jgi:hypothetical protein
MVCSCVFSGANRETLLPKITHLSIGVLFVVPLGSWGAFEGDGLALTGKLSLCEAVMKAPSRAVFAV